MDKNLQIALYGLLTAGSPGFDVYDDVPAPAYLGSPINMFPYVTIGEVTIVPFDTFNDTGLDCLVTIHIWSRYDGYSETKTIQQQIYNILHRATFDVTGYTVVGSTFQDSEVFLDTDGETRHGVMFFRIILD